MTSTPPANFDRIAPAYRWLEYLTLGPILQRCRTHFLPQILHQHHALVLGDGDGRFLATLLRAHPHLHADAVDSSPAMLHLLRQRCLRTSPTAAQRLRIHPTNALTFTPSPHCDLVVAHFFLDCLAQPEVDQLIATTAARISPNALWLISDFRIPTGPLRPIARLYICALYLAFRLLTGLRTTHLPNHHAPLLRAGLSRTAHHHSLFGLLTTEIWSHTPAP